MNANNILSIADTLMLAAAKGYDETSLAQDPIDVLTHDGMGLFILNCGAGTGTLPTCDVHLEHSDVDDDDFTDVTDGAFLQVTATLNVGVQVLTLNTSNLKQYVRAVPVIAGTTPDFILSVEFVGFKKTN